MLITLHKNTSEDYSINQAKMKKSRSSIFQMLSKAISEKSKIYRNKVMKILTSLRQKISSYNWRVVLLSNGYNQSR